MTTRLEAFAAPGHLTDFTTDAQKAAWSTKMSDIFNQVIIGFPDEWNFDGPRSQFYNPLETDPAPDLQTKIVPWVGFPKKVKLSSPTDEARWQKADASRDVQDEYCEWNVEKTGEVISRVTFTCEGPEYWDFLGSTDPDKVVEIYQKYISPDVKKEDLFGLDGKYQGRNRWNDTGKGAMHLIQENNSLFAEIELAAGSSVVRSRNGHVLTDQQQLINCGKYGSATRNSDPFIGSQVNTLTRAGAMVSLLDPVGLYFDSFQPQGWVTPDGSDPVSYWSIVRGTADTPVRAVYEVPAEKGFAVGDIKINGHPIQYGAQIADFVHMKLTAIAQNIGQVTVEPLTGCRTKKPDPRAHSFTMLDTATSLEDILAARRPEHYASRYTD